MIKKIFLTIIIISLVGAIVYTLIPKEEKSKIENTVSGIMDNSNSNTKIENLTLLIKGKSNYCNKGYYHIDMGEDGENIKYFDYIAEKEIYLCNKPNCKHNTKDCNSYLDITGENEIFVYSNNLYLISSTTQRENIGNADQSGLTLETTKQTSPTIYKMNLDGTNRIKLFECPSGIRMIPCMIDENTLYAFFTKIKNISTGTNSSNQMETERKLVKINLKTGKYEEIHNSINHSILGVYKNNVVLEEIVYKADPEKFLKNDSEAINNINNSTKKIKLLNLETKLETQIYQDLYKNMETIDFDGDKVYFVGSKSKKIEYVNIETKEKGTLIDLPKAGVIFQGIYDNKLQYLYYDTSSNEGKVDKAYYIDLGTKTNKEFKLLDSNKIIVEILAENDQYYFVRNGYEMTPEYTTWAGTKQRNIKKTNYALIRKQDYWNSKGDYINMKSTDN